MQEPELSFFDVSALFSIVWKEKVLVLICSLIAGGAFAALTLLMTPIYRVTTVVAEATEPAGSQAIMSALGQLGSLASLAGVSVGGEVRTSDEALAVLESDTFLANYIDENNLMPVLFEKQWDPVTKAWKGEQRKHPTVPKGVKLLREIIVADRDRRTSLISISVEWKDRVAAARWCQGLVDKINAEMQQRALLRSKNNIDFLRGRLDLETTLETRAAVGRLLEVQLKQEMLASVSREYAFRVVSRGVEPESDAYVRPKRMLMAALGIMFGFSVGVLVAFFRVKRRAQAA